MSSTQAHHRDTEMVQSLHAALQALANPETAAHSQRFFRTGPGQYGEGDRFLGIRVPAVRRLIPRFRALPLAGILQALRSPWHEQRLLAILLLVDRYGRVGTKEQQQIFKEYLSHTSWINSWDLVDCSAPHIVGTHLTQGDRQLLHQLALSSSLWERRIAIIATHSFIRRGDFHDTLAIAELQVQDRHDLIHKAVGWMLREVGKRDQRQEEQFLNRYHTVMPRTMLRYAIEKFPPPLREAYLQGSLSKRQARL